MAGSNDAALLLGAEDAQGVSPFQAGHGLHDGLLQVAFVIQVQQVDDDLGVGLALELEALFLELFPQRGVVLDDAVMYDGKLVIVAHMGMGVHIGGFPVGGPSGMADAGRAGHGCAPLDIRVQIFNHADGFFHMDAILPQHGDAGGVVSSIFQFLQSIQQDGGCALAAGEADNTTHQRIPPFSPGRLLGVSPVFIGSVIRSPWMQVKTYACSPSRRRMTS